ncbi:MAG: hypothetical protein V7607_4623 [Solirubrobacteraceae bacterium]
MGGLNDDFGAFYERHVDAVTAYVARRVGRPDLTFDVVAETFARALEHGDDYDPERGAAVAWLFGIARNVVIDAARRGRVADAARRRLGMSAVTLDDDQLARIEERGRIDLAEALSALSHEQREAVIQRVLAEEPYAAIAERVGCSEQVVRQRVSRGLAVLRRTKNVLLFAIVDRRVASVRLHDGRTIASRADRTLPYGWKAVVAFLARQDGRFAVDDLSWTLQDARGAPISTAPNQRAGATHAWTATLPTRAVDPRDPPHARYAIRARPLQGLRAVSARIVTRAATRTPDVNGRAFQTRATTVYYLHARRYRAALLVDARDPSRPAADLPGSTRRADGLVTHP